jgi:hypothetical protein
MVLVLVVLVVVTFAVGGGRTSVGARATGTLVRVTGAS